MKNSDITTIKIYNTKGLLMKTMKGIQNLDTSELKSGYYVIDCFYLIHKPVAALVVTRIKTDYFKKHLLSLLKVKIYNFDRNKKPK
mgnify:CR=1 FL=1